MTRDPYARFKVEETILRDQLAMDRTTLANERTLLAYYRTALAFLVVGVSGLKFFGTMHIVTLGWALIACGVLTAALGTWRFVRMHRRIRLPAPREPENAED
jgi:putative membrane protein